MVHTNKNGIGEEDALAQEIQNVIQKAARPLLEKSCQSTCKAAGWPPEMVTDTLLANLGEQVAGRLGVTSKRVQKAVEYCAQPAHILTALRSTAIDAPKKSRRDDAVGSGRSGGVQ